MLVRNRGTSLFSAVHPPLVGGWGAGQEKDPGGGGGVPAAKQSSGETLQQLVYGGDSSKPKRQQSPDQLGTGHSRSSL